MTWWKRAGVLTVIALWLVSGVFVTLHHCGPAASRENGCITALDAANLLASPPLIQPAQQAGIPALRPGTTAADVLLIAAATTSSAASRHPCTTLAAGGSTFFLTRAWRFLERAAAFPRSPTAL